MLVVITLAGVSLAAAAPTAELRSADDYYRAGQAAEASLEPGRALEAYLEAERLRPDDPAIIHKIAKQYSDLMLETEDREEKLRLANRSLEYSRRAVELEPDNAVTVLSLAISYAKVARASDNRTKVEYSRYIKAGAKRALELDPDYAWAHHVLGRWHLEVATVGGALRFLAGLLYGGLPPASMEEAIERLEAAVSLDPETVTHHVELGFAYLSVGRTGEGLASLRHALTLQPRDKNDSQAKRRAENELNGRRTAE